MNKNNPIREILIEAMSNFFKHNPDALAWSGTATQVFRMLASNPLNDGMLKRVEVSDITDTLKQLYTEGLADFTIMSKLNIYVWTINRSLFQ